MKKFLKPGKEGLLVRDPVSKRPLRAEGEEKEFGSYWSRRLSCGDVVEVEAEDEKPKPKKSEEKKVPNKSTEAKS